MNEEERFEYVCLNVPADAAVAKHARGLMYSLRWSEADISPNEQPPFCADYVLFNYLHEACGLVSVDWLESRQAELQNAFEQAQQAVQSAAEMSTMHSENFRNQVLGAVGGGPGADQMAALAQSSIAQLEAESLAAMQQFESQMLGPIRQAHAEFHQKYARLLKLPTRLMYFRRPLDFENCIKMRQAEQQLANIASSPPILPHQPELIEPEEPTYASFGKQYEISGLVIGGVVLGIAIVGGWFGSEVASEPGGGLLRLVGYVAAAVVVVSIAVVIGRTKIHKGKVAMYHCLQEENRQRLRQWETLCSDMLQVYQRKFANARSQLEQHLRNR